MTLVDETLKRNTIYLRCVDCGIRSTHRWKNGVWACLNCASSNPIQ